MNQSPTLKQQAEDAYTHGDYLQGSQLYIVAAEHGDDVIESYYNAARGYALLGEPDQAFAALERAVIPGFFRFELVNWDPDFASLRGDARWQCMLDRTYASAQAYREFWDGPAMQTPYKENLSEDEKIVGLSKLWAEAKFNFIHFDKQPDLNWDGIYMAYLPKVRATASTYEYYRVLMTMYAQLCDGHTSVWMPQELVKYFARPLVRTALVEDRVMIIKVIEPRGTSDIVPDHEIVEIDGVPVTEYAMRQVSPYLSVSTPQDRIAQTYGGGLLAGNISAPVMLKLRDAEGSIMLRSIPRHSHADYIVAFNPAPMTFTMLAGNIAYVSLNSFGDDKAADMFEAAFDEISIASALLIDVRENGGGSSHVGYRVLACLTDRAFFGSMWASREYRPVSRAWGKCETRFGNQAKKYLPNGKLLFTHPVIVLTSARTYSAAEDFVVAFQGMQRGKIVGETTGGSTGQPLVFPLPGGGGARVCTKHDTCADGTDFVGTGVSPDVSISPTIMDLRAGVDTVLETALGMLKIN